MFKALLSLAVMAVAFINMASAADYTVGSPNGGWDQSTDLTTWASSITFFQGDNLLFRYAPNHNVREVSKQDFDSCNGNNPLQPPHTDGATIIALTSAGTRYFMCGTGAHCLGGMKVAITTLAAAAPAPAPSTTAAVPSSPPPSTTLVASALPPSTTPAVPSPKSSTTPTVHSPPPPKHSPGHPVTSPPSKTTAPSPSPKPSKDESPSPSVVASPPGGSSLLVPAPAPSSAAKFDAMGAITSLVLMIFLINV